MSMFDTLKLFMKAKQAKDLASDMEKNDAITPQMDPGMLGSGGAGQAAQAMVDRKRRLQELERDLFY